MDAADSSLRAATDTLEQHLDNDLVEPRASEVAGAQDKIDNFKGKDSIDNNAINNYARDISNCILD